MSRARIALLPRDGVICKDGRGWYTSEIGRSHSHPWPPPSTIRGALRAAYGQLLAARLGRPLDRGEWEPQTAGVVLERLLTLRRPLGQPFAAAHRLWPAPADALISDGQLVQLRPVRPPPEIGTLGPDDDEAAEHLWRPELPPGKAKPAAGFWTDAQMCCWLRGATGEDREALEPTRRLDLHVALDPSSLAAEPSLLHATETVETLDRDAGRPLLHEWALGVEYELPDASARPRGPLGLGGRRRLAFAEELGAGLFEAPPDLPGPVRGLRLVLATPACFSRGWVPDGFERALHEETPGYVGRLPNVEAEVLLRAALIPPPQHLSSWDMVRRAPRPTQRLVPPGAVYFFQRRDGLEFSREAVRALWLAPLGQARGEALGLVLPGAWNPSTER